MLRFASALGGFGPVAWRQVVGVKTGTSSLARAWWSADGLARGSKGLALLARGDRPLLHQDDGARLLGPGAAVLRRGASPGGDPDPRLDDRDLGPGLHPR